MKKIATSILFLSLIAFCSCAQHDYNVNEENTVEEELTLESNQEKKKQHNYGGWYCPDNLNGFPAVDIMEWNKVPVVNDRMATKEETQNGIALIFVDTVEYPNAKPLDMQMPRLARYYNDYSKKNELVILIQALNISNDSVVGFRYLNGGNGSAWLSDVNFLSDNEINNIAPSSFVSFDIKINATQKRIWEVLTNPVYMESLQPIFDKENKLKLGWRSGSKVNFKYPNSGITTSEVAMNLYGNQYIQIDCELGTYQYVEKFLLLENKEEGYSDFKIVCGPYEYDFENQKDILNEWAIKVKELSEEK